MEWGKAFILIILSLSSWTALSLWLDKRGYAVVNRYLALLLLCLCVPQLYIYTWLLEPPNGNLHIALAAQATLWLKGPLLWSMVGPVTGSARRHVGLQFLPFLVVLAVTYFRPGWAASIAMAGYIHALVYLIVSLRALWQCRQRLRVIATGHQNSAYYWLLYVIAGLLTLVAADLVLMAVAYVQQEHISTALFGTAFMISLYLLIVAFFSIYRPEVFFFQEHVEADTDPAARQPHLKPEAPMPEPEAPMKIWRELDEPLAQLLAERLTRLMEEDQLYRQNELSLRGLAQGLDVTVHQLSELLNVHFGMSFYDFLNRRRLAYAHELLANPQCRLRVVDIAFESGFSNKNTFYRCFREHFAMTPTEYRSLRAKATNNANAEVL